MNFKEIKTEWGILKYRYPNVLESYELLNLSGVSSGESDVFTVKKNILANIGNLFDLSQMEDAKSYNDLINDPDKFMDILNTIADELTIKIFMVFRKKDLSEMR